MTAHNVIRLPVTSAAMDRLAARDRAENIAAELARSLATARAALRFPSYFSDDELRRFCSTLETYGDGMDWQRADQMIHALNIRQRRRAAKAAMEAARIARAEEAPVRIAMRHRPQLLAVCAGWVLAGLVAVAFGWWAL